MNERIKILIGYDGSECSNAALEDLRIAGLPTSVEALVMTVADVFVPPPISDEDDIFLMHVPHGVRLAQQRAERKLKNAELMAVRAAENLRKTFPEWNVKHQAVADSPAWALIRKADEWQPEFVVVGAQGHSVLGGRLILGSVSQRVLYESSCSVRIARHREQDTTAPLRLLVGVDNSRYSAAAVESICRRQWPSGAQVRLVAVVDTVMAIASDSSEPAVMKWIEVGDEENWDQVRQIFEPFAEKLRAAGLDAAVMIRRGNPKEELLEEAESWRADCIFVGAKGVRGVDRLLLGSVSSAVSALAQCSVEVVRPKS